jgi:hypothetical protein
LALPDATADVRQAVAIDTTRIRPVQARTPKILSLALRHNVALHWVDCTPALARHGGVAAMLARDD